MGNLIKMINLNYGDSSCFGFQTVCTVLLQKVTNPIVVDVLTCESYVEIAQPSGEKSLDKLGSGLGMKAIVGTDEGLGNIATCVSYENFQSF